jgi:NAD(P)-dependent dehydrogenase (short-subunit alcohol dehydrogenase family)
MARTAWVTGAGRGIGLELCRQLLEAGDTVVACPRATGSEELTALAARHGTRLFTTPMDVGSEASIASAVREASARVKRVDLLFNNAGIYPKSDGGLEQFPPDSLVQAFRVNTLGPLLVTRHLLPLLRRGEGRRIVFVTSLMGSIGDNTSGGSWAYRLSKSALNMAARNLAHELGREGFICMTLHPGWVQTRMGGAGAPMAIDDSVARILRTTLEAVPSDNGSFKGPDGEELPW